MGSLKGKVVSLEFTLSSDIDTLYDAGYKSMDSAAAMISKGVDLYKDASAKFKQAQDKSDQGIALTKELGIPTNAFDMKKTNSKNAQAKADKNASISILQ